MVKGTKAREWLGIPRAGKTAARGMPPTSMIRKPIKLCFNLSLLNKSDVARKPLNITVIFTTPTYPKNAFAAGNNPP